MAKWHLESGLTRAQLATVLTRLNGDLEYIQTNLTYYAGQCKFSDVPEWANPMWATAIPTA